LPVSFGIVGLPNVGKSTLFNLLTGSAVKVSNYPFCTTDHHDGMVPIQDDRLDKLREILAPKDCIPAAIRAVDIAGLVKGASSGEGLGNQFLAHIREVDVIVHVLRAFQAPDIAHIVGDIDPAADFSVVNAELILSDVDAVERRKEKLQGKVHAAEKDAVNENNLLEHAQAKLNEGKLLMGEAILADLGRHSEVNLLSTKPQVVVMNCDDYDSEVPEMSGLPVVAVPVTMEAELASMNKAERSEFLKGMDRTSMAAVSLVREAYKALGLITFYTTVNDILQAWPIPDGIAASQAAGRIHTDMEKKFARAGIVTFEDLVKCGSVASARSEGLLRTEGKDYVVRDGDIMEVMF
jgi:GTP-binding protein YchF